MRVAKYEFSEGARFQAGAKTDDADAIGKHLDELREQYKGELTPKDVVDDARSHNSPLHSFFEWSDTKAAEQFRLQQARGLIRAVVAVVVSAGVPAQRVQAFVHVPESGAPHYRSVDHAMSQERTREMVLRQAFKEFQAWRKRWEHLDELGDLFKAGQALFERNPLLRE